jgi:hypothetical protein
VLAALALSALLFGAVYAALDLHWKYSTAGQDEVEEAQLARTLLQRIELDIRAAMYLKPETDADAQSSSSSTGGTGGSGGGGSGSGSGAGGGGASGGSGSGGGSSSSGSGASGSSGSTSSSSSTTITEVVDPTQAYGGSDSGILGDAQTLVLHVSRPRRNLNFMPQSTGTPMQSLTSDLQTVSYFLASNSGGTLQAAVASNGYVTATGERVAATGLARMAGDRLSLKMSDEKGDVASLAAHAQILAPEVVGLQFRYYDGYEWLPAWDSVAMSSLPRAIEIQIIIQSPKRANSTRKRLTGALQTAASRTFRLVVAVPIAKPFDPDLAL